MLRHARKAGLPAELSTPHVLRHSFCTRLAEAEVSVDVIRDLARHADVRTTLRYIHTADQRRQAAIDKTFRPPPVRCASTLLATDHAAGTGTPENTPSPRTASHLATHTATSPAMALLAEARSAGKTSDESWYCAPELGFAPLRCGFLTSVVAPMGPAAFALPATRSTTP